MPTVSPTPGSCSWLTREHGVDVAGTAPGGRGWMLVEQPGPWGRKALHESGLDPAIGRRLAEVAPSGVKLLLARRPGRHEATATPARRTVVLAHSGPTSWVRMLTVGSDAELADLDPAVTLAATPPALGVGTDPLWLVCTNGRRDACCATLGRPVAAALTADHGEVVWEISHLGGHRFAGVVAHLPSGAIYGTLDVPTARHVAALAAEGRLDPTHLRGHCWLPKAAQAAEILVRRQLGLDHVDDVVVIGGDGADDQGSDDATVRRGDDGTDEVRLRIQGVEHLARVRHVPTGASFPLSCDRDEREDPGRFELTALTPV